MYKKNAKWLILSILIVILFSINSFSSSKYVETVNKQITLNIRKPTYTLKFHPNNGGADNFIAQSITYGTSENLTANSFTKEGKSFKEWNTNADGTGTAYLDEQEVENLTPVDGEIIDLYAIWETPSNCTYKVIHKKMDLDGENYTIEEIDEIEGEPGQEVIPVPKNYKGFIIPNEQTAVVESDSSTTITYLYERKQYYVSIVNEDLLTISNGITSGNFYYGQPIHIEFTPNVPGVTFHFDDYLITKIQEDSSREKIIINEEIIDLSVDENMIIEPEFSSYPVGYFKPFNGTPWINGRYATHHGEVYNNLYTETSAQTGNGPLRDVNNSNYDEYMFGDMNNPTNGLSKKAITEFKRNTTKSIEEVEAMYEAGTAMLVSNEVDDGYLSPIEVYAWVEGTTMYWDSRAYIVKFHPDTIAPFYCMYDATTIDLTNLDTSLIKNFYSFFNTCLKVQDIKGYINSSGVELPGEADTFNYYTDNDSNNNLSSKFGMSFMFNDCKQLKTLDVSKFDTSNVVDMKRMFAGCGQLKTLNLFSFDTTNVKSFFWMFRKCALLEEVRITSFNSSNVINMYGMFVNCSNLKNVYLGDNFVTPNLYNCAGMFSACSKLERIYSANDFDRTHITSSTGSNMFNGCNKLIGGYEYETRFTTGAVTSAMAQISLSEEHKGYFTYNNIGTKYYINYELNGGTADNPGYYYEASASFSLTRPTKVGYIFKGWTGSNGVDPQLDITIPQGSKGDRDYVANFEPITYIVNFYPNGGTGNLMSSQRFTYDEAQNLSENIYTNGNKVFSKWNTEEDGSGTSFKDKQNVANVSTTNGDIINLYAQWKMPNANISYNYGTFEFNGSNYLDAGIQLYKPENFDRDFEISFDVSDFTVISSSDNRNTIVSAQYETKAPYSGFALQYRGDKNPKRVYFQANAANSGYLGNSWLDPKVANSGSMDIVKENGMIYFNGEHATDGVTNGNIDFNDITSANRAIMERMNIPLTFGANYSQNGTMRRFSSVTLSDVIVTLPYDSDEIETVTMPTPIFTGHTFDGWYTGPNGTGTKVTSGTQISEINTTLYANWISQ